ncbi:MAG: sugar phosphate nucleotidyltransferase [Cyanobacteriota bacterium]|nr:sugar phosphate nucleotidyltransferase [Cyanobacteriota bacterium]
MPLDLERIVAVVLAGGYGTRVQHLLPQLPKPMASVAGKPFLEWVVRYLGRQGIPKILLSTGYLGNVIEEHFDSLSIPGAQIRCCRETEPLGTAGGFLNAADSEPKPSAWLVLNGDSLVFASLAALTELLVDSTVDGAILGVSTRDASRFGTLVSDEGGNLLRFAEKRSGAGTINAGIYLLRPALLEALPRNVPLSFEQDVFPRWLEGGKRLKIRAIAAPFLDIGTPESLPQAEAFIQQNYEQLSYRYRKI